MRIVLQAVDQASGALKGVQSGLVKFTGDVKQSFKNLGNEFEQLISSKIVQFFGVAGLAGAVKKSWEELDRLEASQRKLSGTAKITGVSLDALTALAARAKDQFKLSTVQSNDFAVELAKLATKAGDVGQAAPGLDAFLNIGAARGLTASQTLKAVQQAILGIDEGTDKLFNKNPSVLYQEYADKIGTTAGKLTDQEKAQALLNAALEDGSKVTDAYSGYLTTAAGRQEQFKVKVDETAAAFGRATADLRDTLLAVAGKSVEYFEMFVGGIQLLGVDSAFYLGLIGPAARNMAGNVLTALAELIGESRVLLTIFGDAATTLADRMGNAGVRLIRGAAADRRNLVTARQEMYDEIAGVTASGEAKVTALVGDGGDKRKKLTEDQKKELLRINEDLAVKLLQIEQGLTADQAKEMVRRRTILEDGSRQIVGSLTEGYRRLDQLNLLLAAGFDKSVTPAMKRTEVAIKELSMVAIPHVDHVEAVAKAWGVSAEKLREWLKGQGGNDGADKVPAVLRDIAGGLQVVNPELGDAAVKAVGLADALARISKDPSAIVGAIGNAVALFSTIFSADNNRAAFEAIRKHQEAIEANTRSILEANSPGRVYAAAGRVGDRLFDPAVLGDLMVGFGVLDPGKLAGFLSGFGLTLRDITELAKDFGLEGNLRGPGGGFDLQTLSFLFDNIRRSQPGQFGRDFGSQLDFITRGLNLGVLDPTRQVGTFADLAKQFGATGITDILGRFDFRTEDGRGGALAAFRQLFRDLNAGTVDPGAFGDLTGSQFVTLIEKFIGLLTDPSQVFDGLINTTPNRPPIVDGEIPIGGGDVLPTDPIVKPVNAMVDLLASIDDHLGGFTEAVTRYFGMDPATAGGAMAGGSSLRVSFEPGAIVLNGLATATPSAVQQDLTQAIEEALATRYQLELANRGSASRVG
ncbi:MAG: hypothetical protein IT352_07530 [Gemmatimonadales bacterium]|nr:hypothetical protein [Gemmatimonadales bacterium]